MTISIALCTYNGAQYLQEQLDSIAAQTRLPDELVACDDGSQDSTVAILEEFVRSAPFPVHITINPDNLGSTQNFAQAVSLCRHDLIFLSDQDDVWRVDKIEKMHAVFAAQPNVGLVFTDADVVNKHLQPQGRRLWQHAQFGPKQQNQLRQGMAFELLCDRNVVTGATTAFRAQFKPLVLPIPEGVVLIHDGWVALIVSAYATLAFLPEPLILYRQHEAQQMGTRAGQRPRVLPQAHYRAHLNQLKAVALRLHGSGAEQDNPKFVQRGRRIQAQIRHLQGRLALPAAPGRRLFLMLLELTTGGYHRFSNGWRSFARDLLHGA